MWQDAKSLVILQHDEMQSHLTFALGMEMDTGLEVNAQSSMNVQPDTVFSNGVTPKCY